MCKHEPEGETRAIRQTLNSPWGRRLETFTPRFVKKYAELAEAARQALGEYGREVEEGSFPGSEHQYQMLAGEVEILESQWGED